jgi:Ulp1 family protease
LIANMTGKNIFDLDKLYFVLHLGGNHWGLIVVSILDKSVQFFNSIPSYEHYGRKYVSEVFEYIKEEYVRIHKTPMTSAEIDE